MVYLYNFVFADNFVLMLEISGPQVITRILFNVNHTQEKYLSVFSVLRVGRELTLILIEYGWMTDLSYLNYIILGSPVLHYLQVLLQINLHS